jgi:hypothetical protein
MLDVVSILDPYVLAEMISQHIKPLHKQPLAVQVTAYL